MEIDEIIIIKLKGENAKKYVLNSMAKKLGLLLEKSQKKKLFFKKKAKKK